jgi:hypothetical protein
LLNLLVTLASAAPSIQVDIVLAPQHGTLFLPQNQASIPTYGHINDYNNSQYSDFPNGPIHPDFTQYDIGYMSLYDVNLTPRLPFELPVQTNRL